MPKRINISSGAPWENKVGYSRAVVIGQQLEISGTVAEHNGTVVGPGDAYLQTRCILEKIQKVLEQAGAGMEHIIRTRMYVTDITQWDLVGKAHGEFFGSIKPATTMIEVQSLIDEAFLVEIEASAVIP